MSPEGLRRFAELLPEAVEAVAQRLCEDRESAPARLGAAGRARCRDEVGFHLGFIRSALEAASPQVLASYLFWVSRMLVSRSEDMRPVLQALHLVRLFYAERLAPDDAQSLGALMAKAVRGYESGGSPPREPAHTLPAAAAFREALLAGDPRRCAELFAQARGEHGYAGAVARMVQPALYRIGEDWQSNSIAVAREHLATAVAELVVPQAFAGRAARPGSVIFACVEGNRHVLGARLAAGALEEAGWRVAFLGGDTPSDTLLELVRERRPSVVGLSASLPMHIDTARSLILRLRRETDPAPRLLVGGIAVNLYPVLGRTVGADRVCHDAVATVEAVGELAPSGAAG